MALSLCRGRGCGHWSLLLQLYYPPSSLAGFRGAEGGDGNQVTKCIVTHLLLLHCIRRSIAAALLFASASAASATSTCASTISLACQGRQRAGREVHRPRGGDACAAGKRHRASYRACRRRPPHRWRESPLRRRCRLMPRRRAARRSTWCRRWRWCRQPCHLPAPPLLRPPRPPRRACSCLRRRHSVPCLLPGKQAAR